MTGLLNGRVAIVTGAGGGLGEGICLGLAREGAKVACTGRTQATIDAIRDKVIAAGGEAISVVCDIADAGSVDAMTGEVARQFGGIDILINNAAIYPRKAWTDYSPDEWDQVLETNLKGYFLCARAAVPHMQPRGNGRIINIASITVFGGWSMLLPYVTSKGGIVAFTRALAREIGPDGITVNTISPGAFPTDAERIHPDQEGYTRMVLENQSIKRRGTPDDIGHLVTFLASDRASFITGQMIQIDGGWMMQ